MGGGRWFCNEGNSLSKFITPDLLLCIIIKIPVIFIGFYFILCALRVFSVPFRSESGDPTRKTQFSFMIKKFISRKNIGRIFFIYFNITKLKLKLRFNITYVLLLCCLFPTIVVFLLWKQSCLLFLYLPFIT